MTAEHKLQLKNLRHQLKEQERISGGLLREIAVLKDKVKVLNLCCKPCRFHGTVCKSCPNN